MGSLSKMNLELPSIPSNTPKEHSLLGNSQKNYLFKPPPITESQITWSKALSIHLHAPHSQSTPARTECTCLLLFISQELTNFALMQVIRSNLYRLQKNRTATFTRQLVILFCFDSRPQPFTERRHNRAICIQFQNYFTPRSRPVTLAVCRILFKEEEKYCVLFSLFNSAQHTRVPVFFPLIRFVQSELGFECVGW